jgi:hypothetical protein
MFRIYKEYDATYWINEYASINKFKWEENTKFQPIDLLGFIIPGNWLLFSLSYHNFELKYFKTRRQKVVLKLHDKVDIGYVPKYVFEENEKEFLYDFEILERYQYKPTARLTKCLSGNFQKTER